MPCQIDNDWLLVAMYLHSYNLKVIDRYMRITIFTNPISNSLPLILVSCVLDVPMELATLQEYSPMMSMKLASMVSVLLYVEVTLSTRVCVREYIVPLGIKVSPSFIHVTLVGGEPVEVQVRVEREEERLRSIAIT